MTKASSGMAASLATAEITPRETMTVAFSRRGPEPETTVAPLMAKYFGSPPCASRRCGETVAANTGEARQSANHHVRWEIGITTPFLDDAEGHNPPGIAQVDA